MRTLRQGVSESEASLAAIRNRRGAFPQFDTNLLLMMGIAQSIYVGFKYQAATGGTTPPVTSDALEVPEEEFVPPQVIPKEPGIPPGEVPPPDTPVVPEVPREEAVPPDSTATDRDPDPGSVANPIEEAARDSDGDGQDRVERQQNDPESGS
jgi:hypothetical protein